MDEVHETPKQQVKANRRTINDLGRLENEISRERNRILNEVSKLDVRTKLEAIVIGCDSQVWRVPSLREGLDRL